METMNYEPPVKLIENDPPDSNNHHLPANHLKVLKIQRSLCT